MRVTIEERKIRIPLRSALNPNLIDTGLVDARVFDGLLAVHPSLHHPGAGIWMVTLAPSGQGIIELPSREEAECFCLELLKDKTAGKIVLTAGVEETASGVRPVSVDVNSLTMFCTLWGERRKLSLPSYLAKITIPQGVIVTGWHDRERKI